jgi:hypothetical protein
MNFDVLISVKFKSEYNPLFFVFKINKYQNHLRLLMTQLVFTSEYYEIQST